MRLLGGLCVIGVIGSGAFAATVNITGTVKDGSGAAIANAVVSLASDPTLKDSTDAGGAFAIVNATGVSGNRAPAPAGRTIGSLAVHGSHIGFAITTAAASGSITLFSGNGVRCAEIALGRLEAGSHRYALPRMATGVYVLHLSVDQSEVVLKLVSAGNTMLMGSTTSEVRSTRNSPQHAAAAAVDTLIAAKTGFTTLKKAITSLELKDVALVMQTAADTGSPLPPITDYSSKGPFTTKVETNVGPAKYTIFRPDPLGANGFRHAPIVFGPGIGQTVQPVHTTMLTNFASHGFVVVGTPVLSQGPGGAQNLKTMQDALTWIVAQNTAEGIYKGKLWVDHSVSMGFSVGGTSAVQLGAQKEIFTVVSIHGHTAEAALHGTMLQTTGTNDNVGMPLQQATYDKSKVPTFMGTLTGAAHQYIENNGGGEERKAIVAWMRYWIYNDQGAKNFFYGNDCVLCKSPWQNPQRKNWN